MTRRIHREKGGGAREARKNKEVWGPPLPFPDDVGHGGYVVKGTFRCSMLSTQSCGDHLHCIKRKLLQAFSVISVQVLIFKGLDRNDLR